ncbi:MAG: response regulator [Nitrospira sp.]|nr:response regulator [Nitrospira sp.]
MDNTVAPPSPTLLLIEDELHTADLIKLTLQDIGYEILHVADGKEAARLIDALPPPALILLDMELPHVHGLDLLTQIRRKSTWVHVPVVMLTAVSDKTNICKALVGGATEYILKPFQRDRLRARIEKYHAPGLRKRAS